MKQKLKNLKIRRGRAGRNLEKLGESGKLSTSISDLDRGEHYLIRKVKQTEWRAGRGWGLGGRLGGGRQSQHSECKLKQLCCHRAQELREPRELSSPVTFPGADHHAWVSGNTLSLSDGWALIGHEERHRLPHLKGEKRENTNGCERTQDPFTNRERKTTNNNIENCFYFTLHVHTFAALTSLHAFRRPKPCWWLWWKPAPFTPQSAL